MSLVVELALVYGPLAVLFLAGAVYLQRTGSLSVERMQGTADALGLSAELGKFKVQTSYPVIGIMIIALVCALAPPAYELYLDSKPDPSVSLLVPLRPSKDVVDLELSGSDTFRAGSLVQVPAFLSRTTISYSLTEKHMCPTTIGVYYDVPEHALVVEDNTHLGTKWTVTDLQHPELSSPVQIDATGCDPERATVPDRSPAPLVTRPGLPAPASL